MNTHGMLFQVYCLVLITMFIIFLSDADNKGMLWLMYIGGCTTGFGYGKYLEFKRKENLDEK